MPIVISLFVLCAMVFQLFFRYDHWAGPEGSAANYERDNLTGTVYLMKPDAPVDPLARIFGQYAPVASREGSVKGRLVAPEDGPLTEGENGTVASLSDRLRDWRQVKPEPSVPTPAPKTAPKTAKAKNADPRRIEPTEEAYALSLISQRGASGGGVAAPEPLSAEALAGQSVKTRKMDLNRDGSLEEIYQAISADDGLVDISIVRPSGKELLYGRARSLHVLSTRQNGWVDLALEMENGHEVRYRFSPALDAYQRI